MILAFQQLVVHAGVVCSTAVGGISTSFRNHSKIPTVSVLTVSLLTVTGTRFAWVHV